MQNKTVFDHLASLLERLEGRPTSPAFYERFNLTFASFQLTPHPKARSVAAPYYVTDMGVRRFSDPALFYKTHVETARIQRISSAHLYDTALQTPLEDLANLLDAIILFFGDYDAASNVAIDRATEILNSSLYQLLIHAGTITAASGLDLAVTFFERAADCAGSVSEAYAAMHRAAAFEIKRLTDPDSGLHRLNEARRYIDDSTLDGLINNALYENLAALAYVKNQSSSPQEALDQAKVSFAAFMDDEREADTPLFARASRYRSQIAINEAQLAIARGERQHAVDLLEDNLRFVHMNAHDYSPEALSELSYAYYLDDKYEKALTASQEAISQLHMIGSLSALRSAREIAVASLAKLNRHEEASCLAELIDSDPLGFGYSAVSHD